jgi:hypothetical protein
MVSIDHLINRFMTDSCSSFSLQSPSNLLRAVILLQATFDLENTDLRDTAKRCLGLLSSSLHFLLGAVGQVMSSLAPIAG